MPPITSRKLVPYYCVSLLFPEYSKSSFLYSSPIYPLLFLIPFFPTFSKTHYSVPSPMLPTFSPINKLQPSIPFHTSLPPVDTKSFSSPSHLKSWKESFLPFQFLTTCFLFSP